MSDDEPTIVMWMGKRIDEMTREELIDAITIMARHQKWQHESHMRAMDTMRKFSEARRKRAFPCFGGLFGE